MAHPRQFPSLRLPRPAPGALACIGIVLEGEAAEWIDAAATFATPQERAHAKRFLHAVDAARHLVGRALARRMLGPGPGRPLTPEFIASPWGKPLCPPGPPAEEPTPDFSIAHSGGMVWTAFCHSGPVGIDVERTLPLPDVDELAAQLHQRECGDIRALPRPERAAAFYRCWTRKEAVLKALGRGLNLPLSGFQVLTGPSRSDWLVSLPGGAAPAVRHSGPPEPKEEPAAWTTCDIDAGAEHQCSVAAGAAALPLAVFLA
jgi:4'-phosphopantetheinyl transferase